MNHMNKKDLYVQNKHIGNIPLYIKKENNEKKTIENCELKSNILKLTQMIEDQKWELKNLKKQIEELTKPPYFIATIIEKINNYLIVKMHGNNQEIVTSYEKRIEKNIQIGFRVLLNGVYHVIDIISQTTDLKAQVMELIESPKIDYSMIGGLEEVILEVVETVELPLTSPELFRSIGIIPPSGVLLYGSPGTGKTLIAKAVASKAKATFIRMSGSDLVQKFVGEGARLVKDIFALARSKSPTILFIDEIDAVGSTRTFDGTSGSSEVNRTMLQLLAEMDGFDNRGDVKIIAATNRIDLLDPALLRPGRFDRKIEVPIPDKKARIQILKIHTQNMNLEQDVDFDYLAELTNNFNGADLNAVAIEAGMFALRNKDTSIKMKYFNQSIDKIKNKTKKLLNITSNMFV